MNTTYEYTDALKVLLQGGCILYPTDTIWGIGCDATNARAVEKVLLIKERPQKKTMIILVSGLDMLAHYVEEIPEVALDLMESITDPLTIIYPGARNLAKNLIAPDGSVAIRIPNELYCKGLIASLGRPITSTSANISGSPHALSYGRIAPQIKNAVDYIVPYHQNEISIPRPSSVIRLGKDGEMQIIRS